MDNNEMDEWTRLRYEEWAAKRKSEGQAEVCKVTAGPHLAEELGIPYPALYGVIDDIVLPQMKKLMDGFCSVHIHLVINNNEHRHATAYVMIKRPLYSIGNRQDLADVGFEWIADFLDGKVQREGEITPWKEEQR